MKEKHLVNASSQTIFKRSTGKLKFGTEEASECETSNNVEYIGINRTKTRLDAATLRPEKEKLEMVVSTFDSLVPQITYICMDEIR